MKNEHKDRDLQIAPLSYSIIVAINCINFQIYEPYSQ